MSIEAVSWVLRHSDAKLAARLVLIALADYSHPDGSEAYPSVDTIARHANLSRRSAQSALRTLEADGEIVRDGVGRNGTSCWRLTLGGAESAPRAESGTRGRNLRTTGGEAPSPNPSREPSKEPSTSAERARAKAQSLPDDFPDELKPHARRAFAILRDVAEQYNAREVTPRGVGLAIMGHQGRRFVQTAYELASWAQAPNREIRDVVATYRTFLGRADVCAGLERFDVAPVAATAAPNVHHIRPAGETRFDRAQESLRVLHDRLVAEGR
jgi:hypothetical protein